MNRLKKLVSIMLIACLVLSVPTLANAEEVNKKQLTQQLTPESGKITPYSIMMVRTPKAYSPTSNKINLTFKKIGTVSVDNSGNKYTSTNLIYKHSTSGTTSASFGAAVTVAAEKNLIVAKVSASISFTAGTSVSWTQGIETGAQLEVPKSLSGSINAYIPGVTTGGSIVYSVKDIEHPTTVYADEYKSVSNILLPVTDHIHYVNKVW